MSEFLRSSWASLRPLLTRLTQLFDFYKIGAVNALFGFGVYSLLIFLHMNLFAAQILSHIMGMTFNYFMLRLHVFRGSRPAIPQYILAYGLNYLVSLAILAGLKPFISSPYVLGILAIIGASGLNFVVLKFFVFLPKPDPK